MSNEDIIVPDSEISQIAFDNKQGHLREIGVRGL